jgi:hypothetical protein
VERRKQRKIRISNKVLRGWDNGGVFSRFKELGEIGLAIYFILVCRQNAGNKTFISINQILIDLKLQLKDKNEVIRVLNFLKELKLISCNEINEDISDKEFELLMETDLDFTLFNSNDFEFYKFLGAKGFALFCIIESYIGTNKSGYPSLRNLEKKTGFSKDNILRYIFILNELEIFDVTYGKFDKGIKKNENNEYFRNNVGRIKLLERIDESYEEVVSELDSINNKYSENKSQIADKDENRKSAKNKGTFQKWIFSIPKSENQNIYV